ncbi:tripartite motif-containing protein 66-like [Mya arenaria]|uniref:tripartite motif-containing protein 66-like n=1 Tax=Mya arenaria TaxID=6604 RepID=UPI0022E37CA9|nr:tripartite motif-containing protein 66-like [Mya arenaria]
MFKKHAVLGRKDVDKWVGQGDSLARCELHPEEIIKMECQDHHQLCCHLCVALNHRLCRSISLVEDLARGIPKMADFKQLPTTMSKLTSSLNQVIEDRKMNKNSLQVSGESILAKIKSLRDTLNRLLNELERKTVEQMESVLADLDRSLQKDIDSCKHIISSRH